MKPPNFFVNKLVKMAKKALFKHYFIPNRPFLSFIAVYLQSK